MAVQSVFPSALHMIQCVSGACVIDVLLCESPRCVLNVHNASPSSGDTVRSDALMWQLLIRALMGPSEKYKCYRS